MSFYGTAAGFTTYHTDRGRTVSWTTAEIETALLIASEWLDGVYRPRWIGYASDGYSQTREWPRKDATVYSTTPYYTFPDTTVPDRVINATYEAAFKEATTAGVLTADYDPKKYKSVSIDGAVSVEYNLAIADWVDARTKYPVIETLMSPLLDERLGGNFSDLSGKSERV